MFKPKFALWALMPKFWFWALVPSAVCCMWCALGVNPDVGPKEVVASPCSLSSVHVADRVQPSSPRVSSRMRHCGLGSAGSPTMGRMARPSVRLRSPLWVSTLNALFNGAQPIQLKACKDNPDQPKTLKWFPHKRSQKKSAEPRLVFKAFKAPMTATTLQVQMQGRSHRNNSTVIHSKNGLTTSASQSASLSSASTLSVSPCLALSFSLSLSLSLSVSLSLSLSLSVSDCVSLSLSLPVCPAQACPSRVAIRLAPAFARALRQAPLEKADLALTVVGAQGAAETAPQARALHLLSRWTRGLCMGVYFNWGPFGGHYGDLCPPATFEGGSEFEFIAIWVSFYFGTLWWTLWGFVSTRY